MLLIFFIRFLGLLASRPLRSDLSLLDSGLGTMCVCVYVHLTAHASPHLSILGEKPAAGQSDAARNQIHSGKQTIRPRKQV